MARCSIRLLLLMAGVLSIPACAMGAEVGVATTGSGSVVIINGRIVSGQAGTVVAKGPPQTVERVEPEYTAIRVDAPAALTFSPSSTPRVRITAPANILPLVDTDVSKGTLVIGIRSSVVLSSPILVQANAPMVDAIAVSGVGSVKASGLSGARVVISLDGAGTITASGNAKRTAIRLAGSGDIDAASVRAEEMQGELLGSGTIRAFAARRVEVRISGSGDFIVLGHPTERETSILGSGQVLFQ